MKISLPKKKIKDIKIFHESRYRFSKWKINEIRRNLFDMKKPQNLFKSKIKKIKKSLFELEENLSKLKKYDRDGIEYRGIRNVGNLFNLSIVRDYYKPIKTVDSFDNKRIT